MNHRLNKNAIILAGSSSVHIGQKVADKLGEKLEVVKARKFSDGEIFVKVESSLRGKDIFYFQNTAEPANDNLMELLLTLDAIKRSSPKSVTLIMPYFGYARQDRKTEARTPISAKMVADLISAVGINKLVTLDIHADQIQGFFNCPVDNLYGANIFVNHLKPMITENTIIASPDAGGVVRARYFAKRLNLSDLAIIDKRREKANESEVMNVLGNVEGKDVIIIDDMVDTGGTLVKAAMAFKKHGAKSVKACITHGVLSGAAFGNIQRGKESLDELFITDSIHKTGYPSNITIVDSSDLFSEVTKRLSNGESLSSLFE